jgi:hypothetical protein
MEISHISEEEIQAHAIKPEESEPGVILHIQSCGFCSEQVLEYRRIFEVVKGLPIATFDEQAIAAFVHTRSTPVREEKTSKFPVVLAIISVVCFLFCMLLLFRRQFFSGIFLPELQPLSTLIIASAILILIFQFLDYMRRYETLKKTMKNL